MTASKLTAEALLAPFPPTVRATCGRVRALLHDTLPGCEERVLPGWRAIGFRTPEAGHVCALFPYEAEVRLYFEHGSHLRDGEGVTYGDTPLTRYAIFARAGDVKVRALRAAVMQAYLATCERRALRRGAARPRRSRRG
ncbi:MAG: DUF1801 domain-containing protein [Candidatus Eisenbacteria bacterium]